MGAIGLPSRKSPVSRLFWQPPPAFTQGGVGLLPRGSFSHSAVSWLIAVIPATPEKIPGVETLSKISVWMALGFAVDVKVSWKPSTQHCRFLGSIEPKLRYTSRNWKT